jgi:hypothetical protein
VQQHAIALGYFYLAVICVFTSAHSFVEFRVPLLFAAILALVAGVGYVASPLAARLRRAQGWIAQLIRAAQEPPSSASAADDDQPA